MVLFEEIQRFRQTWIWALILLPTFPLLIIMPLIGELTGAAIILFTLLGTSALVYSIKLETQVNENGIKLRFFPFHLSYRKISFEEIEEFEAEKYSPIMEFGGWGLRWIPFRNKVAYSVSGNQGVRIKRNKGKIVMIGSQKAEELEEAIERGIEH